MSGLLASLRDASTFCEFGTGGGASLTTGQLLVSLRDVVVVSVLYPVVALCLPPANGWYPFGMFSNDCHTCGSFYLLEVRQLRDVETNGPNFPNVSNLRDFGLYNAILHY